MKILRLVIFICTILFFISLVLGMILFDTYSLEFKSQTIGSDLYVSSMIIIPIMLLLTMTGTISKTNLKEKNWKILGVTLTLALGIFLTMGVIGFGGISGSWTNEAILFRNKSDKNISINEQIYDMASLDTIVAAREL